jgi:hypothetical protein
MVAVAAEMARLRLAPPPAAGLLDALPRAPAAAALVLRHLSLAARAAVRGTCRQLRDAASGCIARFDVHLDRDHLAGAAPRPPTAAR